MISEKHPKLVECKTTHGMKLCAPGDKCPVNSISSSSFGTEDPNEQVVEFGSSKLYLSSI